MIVAYRSFLSAALVFAAAASCTLAARAAGCGSDPVRYAPYGMDAVPPTVFYRRAWSFYGSDPVPSRATSNLGFRDAYGLDAIARARLRSIDRIGDLTPRETRDRLTGEAVDVPARRRPASTR